jgi:hypothetical protein
MGAPGRRIRAQRGGTDTNAIDDIIGLDHNPDHAGAPTA